MRKIGIILLILCYFVVNTPLYTFATDVETTLATTASQQVTDQNNTTVENGSYSLDALQPLIGSGEISDNMRAAIVYEANSETLMYTWNPDMQMYPASFVKIMTALMAVEKGSLEALVTVKESALGGLPVDALKVNLVPDEVISLSDLLHCLLIGSANDAANAIAEFIGGSQSEFVQMMNYYAKELGCTATYFTNATGLHDDNQHTTARDIAKIFNAALKNEAFKTIFTKLDYLVPATNKSPERRLAVSSSIQDRQSRYYDGRVIGSRTGVTNDGKRCLAVAAESNGMLVISIVMGSESVYQEDGYSAITVGAYQETTALLNACINGYKTAEVLSNGQTLRQIPIEGAKNHLIVGPKVSVSTVLPEDMTVAGLTFQYVDKPLTLPIEKDQYIGDVLVWNGNMCVAQAELYALNRVEAADITTDQDDDKAGKTKILGVVIVVAIVAILVYCAMRFSRQIKLQIRRIKRKHHRQNRKRAR